MEKFSELIRIRRSMRKFTEEELNQDEVVALLRAALISPSSKGVRPWEFVVVDNKELLQQLAHCKGARSRTGGRCSLGGSRLGRPDAERRVGGRRFGGYDHDAVAG